VTSPWSLAIKDHDAPLHQPLPETTLEASLEWPSFLSFPILQSSSRLPAVSSPDKNPTRGPPSSSLGGSSSFARSILASARADSCPLFSVSLGLLSITASLPRALPTSFSYTPHLPRISLPQDIEQTKVPTVDAFYLSQSKGEFMIQWCSSSGEQWDTPSQSRKKTGAAVLARIRPMISYVRGDIACARELSVAAPRRHSSPYICASCILAHGRIWN
jgi:hypothetical protein